VDQPLGICRNIVLETLVCIGCKSAKMLIRWFLLRVVVLENTTLLQKSSQFSLFIGEGIDNSYCCSISFKKKGKWLKTFPQL